MVSSSIDGVTRGGTFKYKSQPPEVLVFVVERKRKEKAPGFEDG